MRVIWTVFIGGEKSKHDWIKDKTSKWEKNSCDHQNSGEISRGSYAVVVCAIQSEWIFLQWATKDTGYLFSGVENIFHETFLPCIFFGKQKSVPPIVETLSTILVNKSGLDLQDLVTLSN